jgi:lipid II:glycine glycyltransferase (peptidoglycan interpeptide bridge formation enzyme)
VTLRTADAAASIARDPQEWNAAAETLGGHLLQSWGWGDFKQRHGWDVERVAVVGADGAAVGLAQVLFRRKGPVSVGYLPRGPVVRDGDAAERLVGAIDAVARRRRALYLIVEPDRALPLSGSFREREFVAGPEHIQPARTVRVPLLDDEPLLAQMHQKTRYSVRLAQRRNVEFRVGTGEADIRAFYALLDETSERNEFGIHSYEYYRDFLETFGDRAILLLSFSEGHLAAGVIAARFGAEATYMYGGSSAAHRANGAAFLLQFEAMRWARGHGCAVYDLWGIPTEDPEPAASDDGRVAGTKGDDWRGLYKFKVGFGGDIVTYPPTLERRYRPLLAYAARRLVVRRD